MTSKEALCEILKRTDKKESDYTTKCAEIIIGDLETGKKNSQNTQNIADEEKCVKDDRPADIPYDEYMTVVRENEELKETIVKLVNQMHICLAPKDADCNKKCDSCCYSAPLC